MVFVLLCFSAVFLAIVNVVAHTRQGKGVGRATLVSLVGIIPLFFCMASLTLALNALLVAIVGAVCLGAQARPRWFLVSSLGATAVAYLVTGLPDLLTMQRLKKEYPLESLAGRLAYEDRLRMATASLPEGGTPGSAAAAHLAHLEELFQHEEGQFFFNGIRKRSLEHLHAGVVQQFINSPGFGVGRRISIPNSYSLERPVQRERSIPQPTPSYSPAVELPSAPMQVPSESSWLTAHDENLVDFLNPIGFGYIQDREHVAGFRPHQFHEEPGAPERWRVDRLELVGLLKYPEPVVYLSANFPRMDELSEAPTRPLEPFEKEALARLRAGEDLLVQESPRRMHMLGSLRAVQQCLRCHQVQRGELLGAFSYQMSAK